MSLKGRKLQGRREERNAIVLSQALFLRINWGRIREEGREQWWGENTWYKPLKQLGREISPNIQAENTRILIYNLEGQNFWNDQIPGICLEQPRVLGRDGADEMWDIHNPNTSRTWTIKTWLAGFDIPHCFSWKGSTSPWIIPDSSLAKTHIFQKELEWWRGLF